MPGAGPAPHGDPGGLTRGGVPAKGHLWRSGAADWSPLVGTPLPERPKVTFGASGVRQRSPLAGVKQPTRSPLVGQSIGLILAAHALTAANLGHLVGGVLPTGQPVNAGPAYPRRHPEPGPSVPRRHRRGRRDPHGAGKITPEDAFDDLGTASNLLNKTVHVLAITLAQTGPSTPKTYTAAAAAARHRPDRPRQSFRRARRSLSRSGGGVRARGVVVAHRW